MSDQSPRLPLSHSEQRIYITQKMYPTSPMWNVPASLRLATGDADRLEEAVRFLWRHRPDLRMRFVEVDGQPRKSVAPAGSRVPLTRMDWSDRGGEQAFLDWVSADAVTPTPMLDEAPCRMVVADAGNGVVFFYACYHHILADGGSCALIARRVMDVYEALCEGREPTPPATPDPALAARAEASYMASDAFAQDEAYWNEVFADVPDPLDIAGGPAGESLRLDSLTHTFSAQTTKALNAYCAEHRVSPFRVVLAAMGVVLARTLRREDIVMGTATANRHPAELRDAIGMFVSTLALRMKVEPQASFADVVSLARETVSQGRAHERYPYDVLTTDLRKRTGEAPDLIACTLVEVVRQPLPKGVDYVVHCMGESLISLAFFISFAHGDDAEAEPVSLFTTYQADRYESWRVRQMARHTENAVRRGVLAPDTPFADLDLLDAEERSRLLETLNHVSGDAGPRWDTDVTVHACIERITRQHPGRIAATYRGRDLTYGRLDARANALARTLRDRGAGPGTVVGLLADRCLEIVIAQLAILKSGAGFMPIDAEYPKSRIRFMLDDITAPVIVSQTRFLDALDCGEAAIVNLDDPDAYHADETALEDRSGPDDPCAAIYTSGSTGQPKGVLLPHRAIANTIHNTIHTYGITPEDALAKHASFSFDASVLEVFTALMSGARLHVIPEEIRLSLSHLNEYFEQHGITWAFLTTQLGEQFMEFIDNKSLRYLMVGGEKLRTFTPRKYKLVNLYGPTECAIYATAHTVERFEDNIPIGPPIRNDRIYILDAHDHPQPVGAAGELCIAGAGVGVGYHNRPGKTEACFVPDPFRPGERMYRTGDLACWRPDGTIVHLGRMDRQVKLRGFRIELGEIENAMLSIDGVRQAAVADFKDSAGHVFLCGYFCGDGVTEDAVRDHLSQKVPPFMNPARLMRLDALPVNPSGKIDRKKLPPPEEERHDVAAYVAPEGELETALTRIWGTALDQDKVSATADFFQSGGDSLRAVVLQMTIGKELGRDIDLGAIFEHSSPRAMAAFLDSAEGAAQQGIPRAAPADAYPATVAQQQLFLLSRMQGISTAYNIPLCLRLEGALDLARLSRALLTLVDRHEALRTTFEIRDGACVQRVHDTAPLKLERGETTDDSPAGIIRDFVRPFDLSRAPLMRARLVTRSTDLHWLLLDVHHIVCDGVSVGILLRELAALYQGQDLDPPTLQQKDMAAWEAGRADEIRAKHESFWLDLFANPPEVDLPTDRPRTGRPSFDGEVYRHSLDAEQTRALRALARDHGATLHQVLMAGVATLAGRWADTEDVCLGTSMSGRDQAGTAQAVGMFVRTVPTRLAPAADKSFADLLGETKAQMLAIHEHGEYPLSRLYEKLGVNRGPGRHPLFDINCVMRNTGMETALVLGDVRGTIQLAATNTAKFDLSFAAEEHGETLAVEVDFRTTLYDRETVARMVGHLLRILAGAAADPVRPLGALEMLGPEERDTLLHRFNPVPTPAPAWPTVCHAIAEQGRARPDHIAVEAENGSLTYGRLNALANRAARAIRAAGAGPDSIVAVVTDRSYWSVVGMVAALKAGAAFVGLDPHYPAERRDFILTDTAAPCIVGATESLAATGGDAPTIALDGDALPEDDSDPGLARGGSDLAYVIFTSGSTGTPKGVLIEHHSMVNFIDWYATHHEMGPTSHCAAFAAFSFDVSVVQVFAPLVAGATLHVVPEDMRRSPIDLNDYFRARGMSHAHFPTQFAEHFMRLCPDTSLRFMVVGGDRLQHYRLDGGYRLTNEYGPSEATMACLSEDVSAIVPQPPVGAPVANTRVHILDSHGRLCPLGMPGELCVAGAGVGRGYLNRPELTDQRFVADPFVDGDRMFRTGDKGRWLGHGVVDFLGRMDFQIKIRGFRVEPGEIEARIRDTGRAVDCVVVPLEEPGGNKVLAAYLTCDDELDEAALRADLRAVLPDYMTPAHIVRLEKMPLNANGKVDRAKLPRPDLSGDGAGGGPLEPRSPKEARIAEAWRAVLGHGGFGLFDSFFDVGGDSLSAIGLLAELSETFDISASDIFAHTTIAEQADVFHEAEVGRSARLLRLQGLVTPPELDTAFDAEVAAYDHARARDADLDTETTAAPGHVLLTGATGTLGVYLLRELLTATPATITAIVRAKSDQEASARLADHYRDRFGQDLAQVGANRLTVLAGDLSSPGLGLKAETLARLEADVDAVLHSAALTSHYGEWEVFQKANVESVRNLVAFARRGRPKAMHHVSTTSIGAGAIKDRGRALFTEFDLDMGQQSGNLYVRSKLEAEKLLQAERRDGLSVNVYRAGNITCDSQTGAFQRNVDDNGFFQQLRAYVNLGAAPDALDSRNMTFVDQAATAIVTAMIRPGLAGQTFHVQNPRLLSLSEALGEKVLGLRLQRLPFKAFIEFIARHSGALWFDGYIERLLVHLGWQDWLADPAQTVTAIRVERTADLLARCGFTWKAPGAADLKQFVGRALRDRAERLQAVPAFAATDEGTLLGLAAKVVPEVFPTEALLQQENAPVTGVRFVIKGMTETYRHNAEGWVGTVRVSGPGSCLGEEAVPQDGPAVNSVEALEDVFAFAVTPEDMRALIRHHPGVGLALLGLANAKANQAERLFVCV